MCIRDRVNGDARVYGNALVYGSARINGGELYGTAGMGRGELYDGMKFGRGNYGKQWDERRKQIALANSIMELHENTRSTDNNPNNIPPALSRDMEYRGTQSNRRAPRRGRGNVRY